jgi:hypothetical protein
MSIEGRSPIAGVGLGQKMATTGRRHESSAISRFRVKAAGFMLVQRSVMKNVRQRTACRCRMTPVRCQIGNSGQVEGTKFGVKN